MLLPKLLERKDGKTTAMADSLRGKIVRARRPSSSAAHSARAAADLSPLPQVALYFSASWCGACRRFAPVLKELYSDAASAGKPFEVVFVSSDRSSEAMQQYMDEQHGDWLRVTFDDPARDDLKRRSVSA